MPIPKRRDDEDRDDFMLRCMSDSIMNSEYPDKDRRFAVCQTSSKGSVSARISDTHYENSFGSTEIILDESEMYIPSDDEYLDFDEESEDYTVATQDMDKEAEAVYKYEDPKTGEIYFYRRQGVYRKNGTVLVFKGKASAKEKNVKLNKPFRTPDGPKKFSVYVKNDKGNVVKVNFGDPNMEIKRDDPARRKSFRARHKCDTNPGPKWKAKYWSCKFWESKKSVTDLT